MIKFIGLILPLIILGCASTSTEVFIIKLPALRPINKSIGLQIFQSENSRPSFLKNLNNCRYESLGKGELLTLNHSLYATLVENKMFRVVEASSTQRKKLNLRLYWTVRNYSVIARGSQVAGVACVAVCFVNSRKQIVFEEEFFVASKLFHCRVTRFKNKMNTAIVNRMVIQLVNWYRRKSNHRLKLPPEYNEMAYFKTFRSALKHTSLFNDDIFPEWQLNEKSWKKQLGIAKKLDWHALLN